MADVPKWKSHLVALDTINVSISGAQSMALFWQQQRLEKDDAMLDDFLAGNIDYDALTNYFTSRRETATGISELTSIETAKLTAEEHHQDIMDQWYLNQFNEGAMTFREIESYVNTRKGEEESGSDDWLRIEDLFIHARETSYKAEEFDWRNQFEYGLMGYDDFLDKMKTRQGVYGGGTDRHAELAQYIYQAGPEYKMQSIQHNFNSGWYGGGTGIGGAFDAELNWRGYIDALDSLLGVYSGGSGEFNRVRNTLDDARNEFRYFKQNERLKDIQVDLDGSKRKAEDARYTYETKFSQYQAGLKGVDYDDVMEAYNEFMGLRDGYNNVLNEFNELNATLPSEWGLPTDYKRIEYKGYEPEERVKVPEVPEVPKDEKPKKEKKEDFGIYLDTTQELYKLGGTEEKIRREGDRIYLRPEFFEYIPTIEGLKGLTEEQIVRTGGKIYKIK